MNAEQEQLIRQLADPEQTGNKYYRAIAQVVLEHAERIDMLTRRSRDAMPGFYATATAATVFSEDYAGVATDAASGVNSGVLDVGATGFEPKGTVQLSEPISAEELKRRGVTEDLDARAIDVVMRCGWPRHDDPLGMTPCVPVPVVTLERMLDTVATINGVSAVARTRLRETISALLDEQDHIAGLYLKTAEEKSLIDPG